MANIVDQCKRGRIFEWAESGPSRVAASTRKTPRLAAKKVGLATEFQSSAGVRTGEQAGEVQVEGVVSVVVIMVVVVVEEMTGEVVVQMVEAVDHTLHDRPSTIYQSRNEPRRKCCALKLSAVLVDPSRVCIVCQAALSIYEVCPSLFHLFH